MCKKNNYNLQMLQYHTPLIKNKITTAKAFNSREFNFKNYMCYFVVVTVMLQKVESCYMVINFSKK